MLYLRSVRCGKEWPADGLKVGKPMKQLVTVVIPIYGVDKYLDRCVNSVVSQTYPNLEIILVDDGSPDNSPQMCDAWARKDSRIRVIHKENAGLGMARNTGIEHATGSYICFFDSDDYIHSDTIEQALRLALDQEAQIVVFGSQDVDADGKITATYVPATEMTCFRGEAVRESFLLDLIDPRHRDANYPELMLSACCCLFDMELIRQTQFRFVSERQNISEDSYSLIWLYRYVESVALLPEAKYYYCKNSSSLTRIYRPDRYDKIRSFYRNTLAMAQEQGYGTKIQARIGGLFLSFTIAAMKQIVEADMGWREKWKAISRILQDDILQNALRNPECQYRGKPRNLLLHTMRRKQSGLVIALIVIQRMGH